MLAQMNEMTRSLVIFVSAFTLAQAFDDEFYANMSVVQTKYGASLLVRYFLSFCVWTALGRQYIEWYY